MMKRYGVWLIGVLVLGVLISVGIHTLGGAHSQRADISPSPKQLLRQVQATVPWYYRWIEAYGVRLHLPQQWISKAFTADLNADQVRSAAVVRLAALGTNAWITAPALTDIVAKGDMRIGVPAALTLAGMKIEQSPDWQRLAGRLADRPQAVRILEWLVKGSDEWRRPYTLAQRRFGLVGLGAVGPAAKPAAPMVVELLKSRDDSALWPAAIAALAGMKPEVSELLPYFKRVLQDPEDWPDKRASAADVLAVLAPNDPDLRPLLQVALRGSSGLVRAAAARTLWKLNKSPDEVLPALTALLDHRLVSIRAAALDGLAQMGGSARPSMPRVEQLTTDEDSAVRQAATNALKRISARPVRLSLDVAM